MARKDDGARIEMKRCVHACARGDDGRTCGEEGTRGAAAEEQEEGKDEKYIRIRVCGRIARGGDVATN